MVLKVQLQNFKMKDKKCTELIVCIVVKDDDNPGLIVCRHQQIVQVVNSSLQQQEYIISIPSFISLALVQIQLTYLDQQHIPLLNEIKSFYIGKLLNIDNQLCKLNIQLQQQNSKQQFDAICIKMLNSWLPEVLLPLSKQNLLGMMKYRLRNQSYLTEVTFNNLQKNEKALCIYNNTKQLTMLELVIQVEVQEVIICVFPIFELNKNNQLIKILFYLNYVTPQQLCLFDLILAKHQIAQKEVLNQINIIQQSNIQEYFNLNDQQHKQLNSKLNATIAECTKMICGTDATKYQSLMQFITQQHEQLSKNESSIFFYQRRYFTIYDLQLIQNQQNFNDYFELSNQQKSSCVGFAQFEYEKDLIIETEFVLKSQYSDTQQHNFDILQLNYNMQPGAQNTISNVQQNGYKQMTLTVKQNQKKFCFPNMPLELILKDENIFDYYLIIKVYNEGKFLNHYKYEIPEILTGRTFEFGGILMRIQLNKLAEHFANNQDEQELDKLLQSSTLHDDESFQANKQKNVHIMQQNNQFKNQFQQIAAQMNDISDIVQINNVIQNNNNVNTFKNTKQSDLAESKLPAHTTLINMNNLTQLNNEMQNYQLNQQNILLNKRLDEPSVRKSIEQLRIAMEQLTVLSSQQNEKLREQKNQLLLYQNDMEVQDFSQLVNPKMTLEERQFAQQFISQNMRNKAILDQQLFCGGDDFIQQICTNLTKKEIAAKLVQSQLEKMYLKNTYSQLQMIDQVDVNEEILLQLEVVLQKSLQEQKENESQLVTSNIANTETPLFGIHKAQPQNKNFEVINQIQDNLKKYGVQ